MAMRSNSIVTAVSAGLWAATLSNVHAFQSHLQGGCEPQWVPTFSGSNAPNSIVEALLVHDDGAGPGLYVAGAFTTVGGLTVNKIARWDLVKSEWSALAGGISTAMFDTVRDLIIFDDAAGAGPQLFAAGDFATYNDIAKWDGTNWIAIGPVNSLNVWTLKVYDDGSGPALYAGGDFSGIGVMKWNGGNSWSPIGVAGKVRCLEVFDDTTGPALYAGGSFNNPGANIAKWNGQSWSLLGSGVIHTVDAMIVHDDGSGPALFVGGKIVVAGGIFTGQIAKWSPGINGGFWSGLGVNTDCPGTDCLGYCGGRSPVGCYCDELCCDFADCCFDKYATCGGCSPELPEPCSISSFAVHDDGSGQPPMLVAGGYFAGIGGEIVHSIARWDGTSWSAFGKGFPSGGFGYFTRVAALASYSGTKSSAPLLFAGGWLLDADKFPPDESFLAVWTECQMCLSYDINCDSVVNVIDLLAVINAWGPCPAPPSPCPADGNGDGAVNVNDLLFVINNWG